MKYVLGVPFYGDEQRCAVEGRALDRGTMCRHAEHAGATFGCIVEAAPKEAIATAVCLSTDATGIAIQPTQLGDGKRQPCRKGHFFVMLADEDHVFLDFQPKHRFVDCPRSHSRAVPRPEQVIGSSGIRMELAATAAKPLPTLCG